VPRFGLRFIRIGSYAELRSIGRGAACIVDLTDELIEAVLATSDRRDHCAPAGVSFRAVAEPAPRLAPVLSFPGRAVSAAFATNSQPGHLLFLV
jgi:hypothetical protein